MKFEYLNREEFAIKWESFVILLEKDDLRRVGGSWKKFERVKGGKNGRNLMRVGVT